MIADSLGTDTAEQRREEVADLGRRLLPPPRVPNFVRRFGVWADLDRLAHRGPDDPDDPARLLLRLESTADGCRWLLDRWAELRQIVDAGTAWPDEQMVHAIRLLGKRPFDAVNDLEVLTIFVACYVLDRSRPDPFAELWKTTTDREAIYYRQRLLGRRLLEAKPRSKEHAREVLLEIVDQAVSRLEEQERQHRRRERELAALRADALLFDASPEGEWVRREQGKATRSILRITERFRKARKRGETLNPDPPKPPRLEPTPIRPLETRPVVGPQQRMEDPYARPGRQGLNPPILIFDDPSRRQPKEYIGGRGAGRRKEIKNLRKRKRRRCSQEKAERIAIRAIKWLAELGLALLIIASLGTTAGAPSSDRPEDSARRAQPVILDGAPDHPVPGLPGSESLFLPLNRASHPRKKQNEAKDGEVARFCRLAPPQIAHRSDRSRGPPGARLRPLTVRSSRLRAPRSPSCRGPARPRGRRSIEPGRARRRRQRRLSTRSHRESCNFRLRARVEAAGDL